MRQFFEKDVAGRGVGGGTLEIYKITKMVFQIYKFAFLYGDSEYFEWFKPNSKTKQNFKNVIKWKGLHRRLYGLYAERAWDNWQNDTIDSYPPVTRAFLHHLRDPIEWPILDRFVFDAMKELQIDSKYKAIEKPSNWKRDYENGYKKFFNEFYAKNEKQFDSMDLPNIDGIDREVIKRRILDRALWEFGRSSYKKLIQ